MFWYLLTLALTHGLHLHAGRHHNMSNYHMIAQLPNGLGGTSLLFVDCVPNCADGAILLNVSNLTATDSIRASRVTQNIYDIQWSVPKDKQRDHIDMILIPSGCVERTCRISEESYPACKSGSILSNGTCHACTAGAYQNETRCSVCAAGQYSSQGATECAYCPAGRFSSAGASSCVSLSAPVATVQQTITFVGIPKANLKAQRDGLRILIAERYDVPVSHVEILSIGGDFLTGRRLSVSVPVEYRLFVYESEDVQKIQTRSKDLELKTLVEDLVQMIQVDDPSFVESDVTAVLSDAVTNILAKVQETSWPIAIPVGAGAFITLMLLWSVYRTPTESVVYSVLNEGVKDTKLQF